MASLFEQDVRAPELPELWSGAAIVYGAPQAMGSKRAFVNRRTGRLIVTDEKGKKLKTFQEGLREAMRECKPPEPLSGPIAICLEIVMLRPKSHYGTGRNADVLKQTAPDLCTTKPDADKVLRSCLDCGTGIWFRDDAQVAEITVLKRYAKSGEEAHARIDARELEARL